MIQKKWTSLKLKIKDTFTSIAARVIMLIGIGFAVMVIILQLTVPPYLHKKAEPALKEAFTSCSLQIEKINFVYFPFGLSTKGIRFHCGDPLATAAEGDIARVTARISLLSLFKKKLNLSRIQIESPQIVITEGNLKVPESKSEDEPSKWKFMVRSTQILKGDFTYRRKYKDREAKIHVQKIQGAISAIGNDEALKDQIVTANAQAQLENSGHFNLSIETLPLASVIQVDVDLQIENQNLADLTPFFQKMDGVKLKGSLLKGHSSIKIRGKNLDGWVKVHYQGLDIALEKTKDRGGIPNFFANLIEETQTYSNNRHADKTKNVQLQRDPNETIISFILHGMKDAALRVTTRSD